MRRQGRQGQEGMREGREGVRWGTGQQHTRCKFFDNSRHSIQHRLGGPAPILCLLQPATQVACLLLSCSLRKTSGKIRESFFCYFGRGSRGIGDPVNGFTQLGLFCFRLICMDAPSASFNDAQSNDVLPSAR